MNPLRFLARRVPIPSDAPATIDKNRKAKPPSFPPLPVGPLRRLLRILLLREMDCCPVLVPAVGGLVHFLLWTHRQGPGLFWLRIQMRTLIHTLDEWTTPPKLPPPGCRLRNRYRRFRLRLRRARKFARLWKRQSLVARRETQEERDAIARLAPLLTDPNAPPETLATIGQECLDRYMDVDFDPLALLAGQVVLYHLMAHPNTPPELLMELVERQPVTPVAGLCRNPILPLLPLERPDFFSDLDEDNAASLLQWPDVPPIIPRLLRMHPDPLFAWEAESHIAISGEVEAGRDWRAEVKERLARLFAAPTDAHTRGEWYQLASVYPFPEWAQVALRHHPDPLEQAESILNQTIVPPDVLRGVPAYLFRDPYTSDEEERRLRVQAWLSNGLDQWGGLAARVMAERSEAMMLTLVHQPVPSPYLWKVCGSNAAVRLALLRHPHCPVWTPQDLRREFIRRLLPLRSGQSSFSFCTGVPGVLTLYLFLSVIPKLPPETDLLRLRHGDFLTRLVLVERHLSPRRRRDRKHLCALADDPNHYVRAAAREALGR
jgi:hypothetical protein